EVVKDEGDGHGDTGDKAAARLVVPAQEQVEGQHDNGGKHPADDHGGDPQIVDEDAASRLRTAVHLALDSLLLRAFDAVGSGAKAAEQREGGQRHDAEHRDLAERIEAAEIDEQDVDDIASASLQIGVLEEVCSDTVSRVARHHRVGNEADAGPGQQRQHQVAQAAKTGAEG